MTKSILLPHQLLLEQYDRSGMKPSKVQRYIGIKYSTLHTGSKAGVVIDSGSDVAADQIAKAFSNASRASR
jgi:hypothetical protein